MSEEKKENIETKDEVVNKIDKAQGEAPAAEATAAKPTAAKEPVKDQPSGKMEVPANCVGCSKSIKKKRWYYRDGKFYCTKRCWKTTTKKTESAQGEAPKST